MDTFEEIGLDSALVEALAAEGIEEPTALQRSAIPVLRRGTSAVLQAAPGSGLLAAYGIPLLDRSTGEGGAPAAIVVVPSRDRAEALALSLARLATGTNHRVAALGLSWAHTERSDILFSTSADLEAAVRASSVKLDQVRSVVLEGADSLLEGSGADSVATIVGGIAAEDPQVVLVCDVVTPSVRRWVEEHVRRAIYLPPEAARGESSRAPTTRGTIRVHVAEEGEPGDEVPRLASRLLSEGLPHVLVYCRSADRAADLGDLLALRGFSAGRPGDDAEVWLGVDPLEVREELEELKIDPESFVVLSADPPADADTLDRRHGGGRRAGVVIVAPRGLPHLRRTALEAGYTLEPDTAPARDATERADHFRDTIEAALKDEDLVPYLLILEPLIATYGAAEVAGALAALLRKKSPPTEGGPEALHPGPSNRAAAPRRPPAWARLFLSVGRRDGIGTRDLLGAIVGESGITGDQVGRIEVKDHFSRVEVHDSVAERVIDSLNGTSIRGRSVRADFDRGEQRGHKRSEPKKRVGSMHAKRGGSGSPKSRGPEAET